jgi:hypothetical protein
LLNDFDNKENSLIIITFAPIYLIINRLSNPYY